MYQCIQLLLTMTENTMAGIPNVREKILSNPNMIVVTMASVK